MKIDRGHRSWFALSLVLLGAAGWLYWYDTHKGRAAVYGVSGGSAVGLTFGIVSLLCIVVASLKAPRRWVRTWRLGSAAFWMKSHLWLGALALPMAWFHGGFRHGGTLTMVIMVLLYVIILSGVVGAVLQHFMPRAMTRKVPDETIFEQVPQVIRHLAVEAADVAAVCGPLAGEEIDAWRADTIAAIKTREGRALMTAQRREQLLGAVAAAPLPRSEPLRDLYVRSVKPYLEHGSNGAGVLDNRTRAGAIFGQCRAMLPEELQETVVDLQTICDECRQLRKQERMHRWLHGWLMVHVPLTAGLLVLLVVHAVAALRY